MVNHQTVAVDGPSQAELPLAFEFNRNFRTAGFGLYAGKIAHFSVTCNTCNDSSRDEVRDFVRDVSLHEYGISLASMSDLLATDANVVVFTRKQNTGMSASKLLTKPKPDSHASVLVAATLFLHPTAGVDHTSACTQNQHTSRPPFTS